MACHHQELTIFFDRVSTDIEHTLVAIQAVAVVGFIEINLRNFAKGSVELIAP